MRTQRLRPLHLTVLAVIALSTFVGSPSVAQDSADSRWLVRLYGAGIYPTGSDVRTEIPTGSAIFGVSSGTAFGLDLAYQLSPRVSLEAALQAGDVEADFQLDRRAGRLMDTEDISTEIITLGANYHFTSSQRTDLFAGLLVAMATFDGVTFLTEEGLREKRPFDDDVGFGVKVGIDVPLGGSDRWSFNAQVRYLLIIMEAESASGGSDFDLDPFIPSIGIGYRF